MDLGAIGFNYSWIDGKSLIQRHREDARRSKVESEKEKIRTSDSKKSVENQDKGSVVDVSF
jgi:hypothetical protein